MQKSVILRNKNDLTGAKFSIDKALQHNPSYADAYVEKGCICRDLNFMKQAAEVFRMRLESNRQICLPTGVWCVMYLTHILTRTISPCYIVPSLLFTFSHILISSQVMSSDGTRSLSKRLPCLKKQ